MFWGIYLTWEFPDNGAGIRGDIMAELTLAYKARSYSTGNLGRAICNARTHHFVSDNTGGDEVYSGELFLSGIAACAVNMVERIAHDEEVPLEWMDVGVESWRDPEKEQGELSVYDAIRVNFEMWGVADDQAQALVETWKRL